MAKFYQVGGSVRDQLLGQKSKDIDFAVEAASYDDMKDAILGKGGKIFLESPEYFTIRAHMAPHGACDFVLCRKDGEYVDGRRPESVEAGTLYDDLARRDFKMNAIAIGEDGEYIDPFNGMGDISRSRISCVGNPEDRFQEDGLRIIRAIRFAVVKQFVLDEDIDDYLRKEYLPRRLSGVSNERIREELQKAFSFDTPMTLKLLNNYNLTFIFENNLWLEPTMKKR